MPEDQTPPTPGVTPGTPGTPVTGTSLGVTPPKPPTTLEEALAKLADLEHSVRNKTEENDRHSKKIQEFEAAKQKLEDAQKKQEQAAAKALEDRLKQQGEFQKLAEQHEAKVKELEPTVERYTALTSLVSEQIEAQIKDWPAEAKIFDPGKDASIEQRLDWMNKAKALVDKLQAQATSQTKPGNGPNPKPAGEPTSDQQVEQKMKQLQATRKYF